MPSISINLKIDNSIVIQRLCDLLTNRASSILATVVESYYESRDNSIVITPCNSNGIKGLQVMIITYQNLKEKVFVELISELWEETEPAYDFYVSEAKRIMFPLLREYNKKYKSRIKLSIQSKSKLKIRLPKLAFEFFMAFAEGPLAKRKHPANTRMFYFFVWHCHARNVKLISDDLKSLLIEYGFDSKAAFDYSERYRIIRGFLQTVKQRIRDRDLFPL